ncbi:MAG: trigger factor [Lachnospiraceae bacterium]|nr:trigger factor [Lachnospiraceae bacterium]
MEILENDVAWDKEEAEISEEEKEMMNSLGRKARGRRMKTIFGALVLSAALMTGCGGAGQAGSGESAGGTVSDSDSSGSQITRENLDLSSLVTLGDYKGLKVTIGNTEISEEDLQSFIDSMLESHKVSKPVTDRAVKEGDTVNIDYEGKKDGEPFQGGSAKGYNLEIGSGSFIDGFEDGLVGAEIGEERSLNLRFPDNYHAEDLAGQDVVFDVKVNSISENELPELTDELVKEINSEASTVEEFREQAKEDLRETRTESVKQLAYTDLLNQVKASSKVVSGDQLPADLVKQETDKYMAQFSQMLTGYGMNMEDFLDDQNMNEEDLRKDIEQQTRGTLSQTLVIWALANAENIEVTDADMDAFYEKMAKQYGLPDGKSFKDYVANYGSQDDYVEMVLENKVGEMLLKNADVTNPEMISWK